MAVRCSFDSDWDGLSKRFIFSNGGISKAVLLTSNEAVLIPHEVLTPGKLHISIVGQSENGEKKLTTAKAVPYITVLEAGPQDGNDTEAYSPELWEQALISIGDLTSLTTDKKNNIVSAINELNKSGTKTISGFKSTTKTSSGTLIGDVNGDGVIDTIDLIALQRYLEGTVTDIDIEAADLNGDGVVNAADFELMQKLFETRIDGQLIARIKITYTDGTSDTIYEWVDTTGKGEKGEQGPQGEKGKSAYAYAQDGGYTGTEAEFAEKLASNNDGDTAIPAYITAESERVANKVQATRTAKSLVFAAMSDIHVFDGNKAEVHRNSLTALTLAGMGIKELKKRMRLDFVGFLGDYTWGAATYTVEQVKKDITATRKAIDKSGKELWCIGNHDLNYGASRDRLMTLDELYAYIGANSDGVKPYTDIERCYGYLDFDNQKTRVIYLNTCDTSDWAVTEGEEAPASWISPTQIQWLADTALDFSDKASPSEWGIAIMSHHPLHYGQSCFDCTMKILEAYRDGLSGTLSCTLRVDTAEDGTKTYPQQKVTYDFSDTERAEIICNIHGHNHNCGYSQISSTTRIGSTEVTPWLLRLCVPQICASRYNSGFENAGDNEINQQNYGEFDENGNPVYWYKETGTAKATSFCVINIDRKNKKVFAFIFGAGKDRIISYDAEYIPAEYSISVTAQNCTALSDNPATITENSTATLTFAANDGYALPDSITVTGVSYTWDKTSGTLNLSNPTSNVTVSVVAIESVVEPMYTNHLTEAGYTENTKISSSGGSTTTAPGYASTGYIPIAYGSNNNAQGEQVIYLKNIEGLPTDSDVRIAFYDADKAYINLAAATSWLESAAEAKITYTLDGNGYINSIDVSAHTSYLHKNLSKNVAYFRFCAPGIDGDSIITVNQRIV